MPSPSSQWRLNIGGIPVKLVSRKGMFSLPNSTAVEEYVIEADRLLDLATAIFPVPYVVGEVGNTSNPLHVVFPTPLQFSGFNTLIAQNLTWEALTGDGFSGGKPTDPFQNDSAATEGTYEELIKVTITYGTSAANDESPDSTNPLTFLERNSTAGGTFLSEPLRGTTLWQSTALERNLEGKDEWEPVDNDGPDVPFTVTEVTTDWTLRWPQVPFDFFNSILVARLRGSMGKVNSTPMATISNAPVETILFQGYRTRETFTFRTGFAAKSPLDITMSFIEKNMVVTENRASDPDKPDTFRVTHNHFHRPGVGWRRTGRFRAGSDKDGPIGTAEPAFELIDLNAIFSVSE